MQIKGKEYGFFMGLSALEELAERFGDDSMSGIQERVTNLKITDVFPFIRALIHNWCILNDVDMPAENDIRAELDRNFVGVMAELNSLQGVTSAESSTKASSRKTRAKAGN